MTVSGGWLRSLFVVGEIALSIALLAAATVFSWSLYQLRNIDPGYTVSHLLTFGIDSSTLGKPDPHIRNDYENIRDRLVHQPGVHSVVYAMEGLITNDQSGSNVTVSGYTGNDTELTPDYNWISPGFFSTMQVPVLAGHEFTAQDTATSQKVAVVDEAFVKHYFGGDTQKALRGEFAFGASNQIEFNIQIVGVIPTIRATTLAEAPGVPFIYLPYDQTYSASGKSSRRHPATFYIRTSGDPVQLAGTVRAVIHDVDHNLPVIDLETMQEHLNGAFFDTELMTALSLCMGGLALALAGIGLYGVLAFVVGQRTREIGIRIAVGADKWNISTLVLRQVGVLVAAGLGAGLALAWVAVGLLKRGDNNLHGVPLWLYSLTGLVLVTVMLIASWLPARRAASIDPMKALRTE